MKKIRLWKNRNELSDEYAIVDDEDYDKVMEALGKRAKWYLFEYKTGRKYAKAAIGGARVGIHRLVMDAPVGVDVAHINNDGLDNRKENLRICTRSQNCNGKKGFQRSRIRKGSQSGYRGVYEQKKPRRIRRVDKKTGKITYHEYWYKRRFQAYISDPASKWPNKRNISLGYFHTAKQAARAYNKAAREMHGESAVLNKV